nr:putative PsbQ protein homologue precursor [Guillardia theta]
MQMDRRAMVKGVAAAVVAAPAAAFASIGDSPKQSYFGAGAMSAPFGDVYGLTGPGIWSKMNDTERGIYERILGDSKKRLQSVEDYINNNEWDRSRTALRLGMYETRKAMIRINEASGSQEAKDLFAKFKRQLEATDFALAKKDGALAFKLRAATEVTFSQWLASVGL